MNDQDASLDQNTISRLRNNLVGAIGDQVVLPKIIVIVPDNDIIKYFWYKDTSDVVSGYSQILCWLMTQYDRLISAQKDNHLPSKAKISGQPNFVWIIPPLHTAFKSKEVALRKLFAQALTNVAALHDNTYALELKKS